MVNVSNKDFSNEVYVVLVEGEDSNYKSILINKVTFEFKEYFPYFDYILYKNSILDDLY